MPGSVILHPCVDVLIGISHQTHYRLYIFVRPVPLGLQPGRPSGYYGGTCGFQHLCNLIPLSVMIHFFAKRWVLEVPHRHPCNLCIVSLYESGKQCWVQSLPPKCSVIGAGHGPSSNIYVANITI